MIKEKVLLTIKYCCWNETQPQNKIMVLAGPDGGTDIYGWKEVAPIVAEQSRQHHLTFIKVAKFGSKQVRVFGLSRYLLSKNLLTFS